MWLLHAPEVFGWPQTKPPGEHFGHRRYPHRHHALASSKYFYVIDIVLLFNHPWASNHPSRILISPYQREYRDHPQTTRYFCWHITSTYLQSHYLVSLGSYHTNNTWTTWLLCNLWITIEPTQKFAQKISILIYSHDNATSLSAQFIVLFSCKKLNSVHVTNSVCLSSNRTTLLVGTILCQTKLIFLFLTVPSSKVQWPLNM